MIVRGYGGDDGGGGSGGEKTGRTLKSQRTPLRAVAKGRWKGCRQERQRRRRYDLHQVASFLRL
jgi:hypothetical protein